MILRVDIRLDLDTACISEHLAVQHKSNDYEAVAKEVLRRVNVMLEGHDSDLFRKALEERGLDLQGMQVTMIGGERV